MKTLDSALLTIGAITGAGLGTFNFNPFAHNQLSVIAGLLVWVAVISALCAIALLGSKETIIKGKNSIKNWIKAVKHGNRSGKVVN